MQQFKLKIVETCQNYLNEKILSLKLIMQEVTDAANSETKSSAGDKHETARAMMQLEQEKLSKQIADLAEQKTEFDKIDFTKSSSQIIQGSLIETNKSYFLIATSIGKIEVQGKTVFVISNKSPLAIALYSKKQNDIVTFNGVEYSIKSIL
jgi:transcription elongation GreA/GreB family factor